ncbi:unnamed protein product [Prorocentrum cordatum]|uniref:Uncharacterized protein n=1 Tax=Prorocentrum cordatum TaxID=2364126 RepID=A0ABN9SZM2_9DINO|nr:unnamed protein product [Polarella glacialis]
MLKRWGRHMALNSLMHTRVMPLSRHTLDHVRAAAECGFGGNPFVPCSFGPRADRVLHLLLMPPILSLTSALQMLLPSAEPLCSLLRVTQAMKMFFLAVRLPEPKWLVCDRPKRAGHM